MEKHDSNDDTNDEFPSLARLLCPKYKRKLAEEKLLRKSIIKESNNRALDENGSYRSSAPSSYGKRTKLLG